MELISGRESAAEPGNGQLAHAHRYVASTSRSHTSSGNAMPAPAPTSVLTVHYMTSSMLAFLTSDLIEYVEKFSTTEQRYGNFLLQSVTSLRIARCKLLQKMAA